MAGVAKSKERPEKILVSMYQLANGTTQLLQYEDIVVKAFNLFPDEFALRGYPQYPDSSDLHKPLYGPLKRDGFVRSGQKKFGLTPAGAERARALIEHVGGRLEEERDARRLTRAVLGELERMLGTAAVDLYRHGKISRALDTDFYSFVGATVRTPPNDFLGRVTTTENTLGSAIELQQPDPATAQLLLTVWTALREKHGSLIDKAKMAGKRK